MAKLSSSGQRRTGDFQRRDSAQVQLSPEDIKKSGVRVTALRVLLKEAEGNIPALALAVGLGTQRVRDALDGVLGIGSELAAHMEHTAHLPGAWLDHPDEALPEKTKERIQKAMRGEQLDDDEDDDDTSMSSAAAQPAAAPKSQAFVDVQETMGLRVVKAPPRISVRRRRVTQAEELAPEAPPALVEAPVAAPVAQESTDLAQAPRRGRKPGVKSVSDDIEANRREWLRVATEPKNAKSQLCRLLQAPDSFVAHLLSGRRTFTDKIAGKIEEVMHLPQGTIDGWTEGSVVNTVPMPTSPMPVAPQVAVIEAVEVTPMAKQPVETVVAAPAAVVAAPAAVAPAPVATAPAPAPVAAPVDAAPVASAAPRALDEYLETALKGMLEKAIVTGKLTNQVALSMLNELATL